MQEDSSPATARPPVALGCFFAASVVVVIVGIIAFAIVFLESGADTGEVRLDQEEAYAPGSVEFVGEHNFFLVRLPDGSFVALADMDAQNRATEGARCRVALTNVDSPDLDVSPQTLRALMSPRAAGAVAVLRETCFGAIYDAAGVILAPEGRNLDQYAVDVSSGVVNVDRSERICSERTRGSVSTKVTC